MNLPEPVPPKKSNKTVWIIVIVVAVILLGCLLAAVLAGGYLYLRQRGMLASLLPGSTSTPTATNAPTATRGPMPTPEPLAIEPANPTSTTYPTLQELVPNWSGSVVPASQTWDVLVIRNQPVLIFLGWCATTPDVLAFNLQHIRYTMTVDGQPFDVNSLYKWDSQESDRVCQTWVGLIRQWSGTHHTIVTTMSLDWAINDGWDDYPGGDYTDVYEITVTP